MHICTHSLDVMIHQFGLVLQFVDLVEAGVICNTDAVQTMQLMVYSNSFRRRSELRVIHKAFAFGYKLFPCFLRVDCWAADEGMVLVPDLRCVSGWCCDDIWLDSMCGNTVYGRGIRTYISAMG